MRRILTWGLLACLIAAATPAWAATGRVMKVLPFFLDAKGRHADSPSLYDRDAYQFFLRQNPEKQSGMLFDVHWKAKGDVAAPLKLRLELRGVAQGNLPRERVIDTEVQSGGGWLGRWTGLTLTGEAYKAFGKVTAWRVTLWEGERMLASEQSFLW